MQEKFFEAVSEAQRNEWLGQIAEARNAAEPYFAAIHPLFIEYGKLAKTATSPAQKLISMHLVSVRGSKEGTGEPIGQGTNFVLFEMPTNPLKNFWERPNSLFVMPQGKTNLYGKTFFGDDDSGRRQLDIPVVNDAEVIVDRLSIQLRREGQIDLLAAYKGKRSEGGGEFNAKIYPLYDIEVYRPYARSESRILREDHVATAQDMTKYLLGKLDEPDFKAHLEIAKMIVGGKNLSKRLESNLTLKNMFKI